MSSEHYKCVAELSITDIKEGENEQIESRTYFDAIHDILNREIMKEEPIETKPFSEFEVSNEGLENGNEQSYYQNSSEIEVKLRNSVESPNELKFSPTFSFKNITNVNHFNNEVIIKIENEDHAECNDNLLTNNAESKMETLITRDDIDIPYEDDKPEVYEEKLRGKSENESYPISVVDISIGTEIGPNFSHELLKDFWENKNFNGLECELENHKVIHLNNGVILMNEVEDHTEKIYLLTDNAELKMEALKAEEDIDIIYECVKPEIDSETWLHGFKEDGTSVERDNDTRREPTVTSNSKNCQMIQKLPHCKYSKCYPIELKQEINERPHTGEEPFQCKSCLHTDEKPYVCKICLKPFSRKWNLTVHEKIHTAEKPYSCKFCSKTFTFKITLLNHEIIHTVVKPFTCKICSKSFSQKEQLTEHERFHTGERQFQCKVCSKSFGVKSSLLIHERIHTGEKPYQCKLCEKSYRQKFNLTIHERIHTGEKPFQCKVCLKDFADKHILLAHERIHTGEKPFKCKVCLKSFAYRSSMFCHKRIHTSEKPYQCKICSKIFKQKKDITRHEIIHRCAKPFRCKICSESFNQKGDLTTHLIIHTGKKPFLCKV